MGKQHIIELNGKRYDAVTGKSIAMHPLPPPAVAPKKAVSMDGFARTRRRQPASNHVPPHKTERAKTLMRSAVQKPAHTPTTAKLHARILPSASVTAAHTPIKTPKAVQKSSLIRRFGDLTAVQPPRTSPPTTRAKTGQHEHVQAAAVTAPASVSPVAAGLAKADSHTQQRAKRPRLQTRLARRLKISPRTLSAASLALSGLLIGGFFAYQNVPNLSMRIASARAGLQGSLPDYQPAGFGLQGGISYRPGQIEVAYNSTSDDRNYKITQTASNWNSETLAQNYEPLKENSNYQTVPNNGKTVYIYDGSNATWVDGGVWYRIEGDSKLSSDQLLNVADSL